MATLVDIVAYFLEAYPHKDELSNARVTKMVYLADWRNSIDQGHQLSSIEWVFDDYGPFVPDVANAVRFRPDLFKAELTLNMFGGPKLQFSRTTEPFSPKLSRQEKATLDRVIEATQSLTWGSFIKFVYSTFPVEVTTRYRKMDLPTLAAEYRALLRDRES